MTDAYDELRKDWCDVGDLPRATCAHCNAQPGDGLRYLDRPWTFDGQPVVRRSGRNVFPTIADPPSPDRPPVKRRGRGDPGHCACGTPTRDQAYGCDHCAGELERVFAEAPWLAEQLDATITRQRAAAGGASSPDSLPWNDKAARILADLRKHLTATVRLCDQYDVRNQSPYPGGPDGDSVHALSAWLLWRVDGLTFRPEFTDTLKTALRVEADALLAIDRGPDLLFLGVCDARDDDGLCGGAIYARAGDELGKCRACRAEYDTARYRGNLEQALDDRLCTASEIAHLATYLGLPSRATRDRVRNLVNQWHKRGRIKAVGGKGEARFRYGDVIVLLAAAYPDEKGA